MTETLHFDLDAEEKEVFCLEAEDLIGQLDGNLLSLERGQRGSDVVNGLFRAAHTLKGSAGAIGHYRMSSLTHAMEAVLELLRQGRLEASPELADLMLAGVDMLRALCQEVSTGEHSGVEPADLTQRLKAFAARIDGPSHTGLDAAVTAAPGAPVSAPQQARPVRVHAHIAPDSIAPAARALQVIMALQQGGAILWSNPTLAEIEEQKVSEGLEALVATERSVEQIEAHLRCIGDLTHVSVAAAQPEHEPEPEGDAGEPPSTNAPPGSGKTINNNALRTVRTSVERLDKLMNLVGELVTDRNRLLQAQTLLSAHYQDGEFAGELAQAIAHLASITDELQEEVMRARMLPLEHAFNKLPRMVRDLARDSGKSVILDIEGQETELDRTVIEEIGDPLLHLLRNAMDHGIEPPEERRAAGKSERGIIRLSGRSEGNHIVITIADDGRGIDMERVRHTALERGILSEEAAAHLSEADTYELIFAPGLSTAKRVTDISGRGVGMDVVRNNIERLHGSVTVRSQPGRGTTFELSLPLTLAIMPVLLVGLNGCTYCIPLNSVTEVLSVNPASIHTIDRGEVIQWRQRLLPLVRLRQFFGMNGLGQKDGRYLPTVAVRWGEEHVGLVVDSLQGQHEIVIKSLGYMIGQVAGLSGSAILGDGSVALIVDVPGLIKRATLVPLQSLLR